MMDPIEEVSLDEAWQRLKEHENAVLIDVRTRPEWQYVGIPDISSLDRELRLVEWIVYPDGAPNAQFLGEAALGLDLGQPVLFLCRSGARSLAAARALASSGFTQTANVTAGFEGDLDAEGHRHGGWKDQLPWKQS